MKAGAFADDRQIVEVEAKKCDRTRDGFFGITVLIGYMEED